MGPANGKAANALSRHLPHSHSAAGLVRNVDPREWFWESRMNHAPDFRRDAEKDPRNAGCYSYRLRRSPD